MWQTVSSSTLTSRLGLLRILSLCKREEMALLKRFSTNKENIAVIKPIEFKKSYVLEGLKKLENRCTMCIKLKGDYE